VNECKPLEEDVGNQPSSGRTRADAGGRRGAGGCRVRHRPPPTLFIAVAPPTLFMRATDTYTYTSPCGRRACAIVLVRATNVFYTTLHLISESGLVAVGLLPACAHPAPTPPPRIVEPPLVTAACSDGGKHITRAWRPWLVMLHLISESGVRTLMADGVRGAERGGGHQRRRGTRQGRGQGRGGGGGDRRGRRQGLTLVHFSAQLKRFFWDKRCVGGICGGSGGGAEASRGCFECQKPLRLS